MKLHGWIQTKYEPGHKRQRCLHCGAARENFQIGIKYASNYGPWMLNGKRQKYCPRKEGK